MMLTNETQDNNYDVIVIGGGPAGATAALYTARAGLQTLVLDKGLTAGALGITSRIENYPGVNGGTSGAELLERMRAQACSFGAIIVTDKVIGADLSGEEKTVFSNNGAYSARAVVIASGAMGRGTLVKGEAEMLGKGVSYCATCDAAFFKEQEVAVAGSSDEAIEEALYLTRFASRVHFLCPGAELKAPAVLVDELENHPRITLYRDAHLREIIGREQVEALRFDQKDNPSQTIAIKGVFVYLQGGRPITDFLQGQLEVNDGGCLAVDHEYRTTVPNVFAVGDVLCKHVKQVVVAAGEGATAGMAVEKALRGRQKILVDWAKSS